MVDIITYLGIIIARTFYKPELILFTRRDVVLNCKNGGPYYQYETPSLVKHSNLKLITLCVSYHGGNHGGGGYPGGLPGCGSFGGSWGGFGGNWGSFCNLPDGFDFDDIKHCLETGKLPDGTPLPSDWGFNGDTSPGWGGTGGGTSGWGSSSGGSWCP
jgi:hypothetical protein